MRHSEALLDTSADHPRWCTDLRPSVVAHRAQAPHRHSSAWLAHLPAARTPSPRQTRTQARKSACDKCDQRSKTWRAELWVNTRREAMQKAGFPPTFLAQFEAK